MDSNPSVNALRQLGRDIHDPVEHLDRLEDIELTGVNRSIQKRPLQKTGKQESYWSWADFLCLAILKNYIPQYLRATAIVGKGQEIPTLAKAICGFITTEGQYTSRGEDIKQESVKGRVRRVGYVAKPQSNDFEQYRFLMKSL